MVRLKHRYILLNILYPQSASASSTATATTTTTTAALPDPIRFLQPTSDKLTPQLLTRTIRDGVADLFGDYGSGMVAGSLVVKYLSPATSTAIVRVSRAHYRLVWAALTFVTRLPLPVPVGPQECVFRVVRVSGTIRKAEEEAIRRAKGVILRARRGGAAAAAAGKGVGVDVEMGDAGGDGGGGGGGYGIVDEDEDEDEDEE